MISCYITRFLQGLGSSMISTSCKYLIIIIKGYAIITYEFSTEREKYIGFGEASAGIGIMLGPVFGSTLYQILGYMPTFLAISLILFFNLMIVYYFLPSHLNHVKVEE